MLHLREKSVQRKWNWKTYFKQQSQHFLDTTYEANKTFLSENNEAVKNQSWAKQVHSIPLKRVA